MTKKKKGVEILQILVSVFSIIGVLAALVVVPEFRRLIGLDPAADSGRAGMAVIFDDDGSLDGTAALLYLLAHPDVEIRAVTVSYGEAHPDIYVQHLGRLLDDLGYSGIPLGAGQDGPIAGRNSFPDWMRELSDAFWNIPLPNQDRKYLAIPATDLLINTLRQSKEPVTIFMSGPATNLAQALRIDPGIAEKIRAVYLMGGAVYVPGNMQNLEPESPNMAAEWNIYTDPAAAQELFQSGLDLYLVPLDATDQVTINSDDTRLWRVGGKTASYAAQLYDLPIEEFGLRITEIWDLLAAVVMVEPDLCGFQTLSVDVITMEGDSIGQTLLVPGGQPNVSVCLYPDPDQVRQRLIDVFSRSD